MSANNHHCPFCGDALVQVEAAVNGKSEWPATHLSPKLLIRSARDPSQPIAANDPEEEWTRGKQWVPYMDLNRTAAGLYCNQCGSLTITSSIPADRKELELDT